MILLYSLLLSWAPYAASERLDSPNQNVDAKTLEPVTLRARHVARWPFYGIGKVDSDHSQVVLSEDDGSKGVMLVSPEPYCGDVTVRYDVHVLLRATVMITNLATMNTGETELTFPAHYDGNVDFMFESLDMYNFVYHGGAHNREGPFLRRLPTQGKKLLSPDTQHHV